MTDQELDDIKKRAATNNALSKEDAATLFTEIDRLRDELGRLRKELKRMP